MWRGSEEHVVPPWGHRTGLNRSCWEAYLNGVTAVNVRHAAFVTPPSPRHPGRHCRSCGCVATCCDAAGDADPAAPFLCFALETMEACCLNLVTFHPFAASSKCRVIANMHSFLHEFVCVSVSVCVYIKIYIHKQRK